jgi:hypothetical protein
VDSVVRRVDQMEGTQITRDIGKLRKLYEKLLKKI